MKKPMFVMLIMVACMFGAIFGWKEFKSFKLKQELTRMHTSAVTVSTIIVNYSTWKPTLKVVGTIRAINGVNVTTELPGMVQTIYFTPGSKVNKGDLLAQLNADTEIGQLHALEAQVELAKITFERDKLQYAIHSVSEQALQSDELTLKNLQAQVAAQTATVEKKSLRAPFSGRLGISMINPGQYLNNGDPVTTLQTFDPIYVDFYVPQQVMADIKLGQEIKLTTDTYPGKQFIGKITTIQPLVDINTRNIEVEATIRNPRSELVPGMFASVDVEAQKPIAYLTLPQTAISFSPFGEFVFVVKSRDNDKKQPVLYVEQRLVKTGATRGEEIAILKGLKAEEIVVTSGQLKLKKGRIITINNSMQPDSHPTAKMVSERKVHHDEVH